jgi:hypothetical protein
MDGIFTSRLHLPPGVSVVSPGLPREERRKIVPDYFIIPPSPSTDGDDVDATVF